MNKIPLYRWRFLYFLLILCLLSGCLKLPDKAPFSQTKTTAVPPVDLENCSVGAIQAKCGYLHVPEDRSHPDGRTLNLKIVIVPARQENHDPDPLFYITGGPGGIDTDPNLVKYAYIWFWDLNDTRDIVYIDQRGTNEKHKLSCALPPFTLAEATQTQIHDWMNGCMANLDGDPRFYTTVPAMQDLDQARAALGYDKINLYGGSYGTVAEQVYMRMFPEHVRTAVLDHGTALDVPFLYVKAHSSQLALDQIITYCDQDARCHAAFPDIRGELKAVLNRLFNAPVVTSFTPPGQTIPDIVTRADAEWGIHQMMWSGYYSQIPAFIHLLATSEDWTPIVKSFYEQQGIGPEEPFEFMPYMIFCFEPFWGTDSSEAARRNPDSYLLDFSIQELDYQAKICAELPKPAPSLVTVPGQQAAINVLMLNSLLDPQNPPSNMDPALKEYTKSIVVVEPTEGHITSDSPCRWGIATRFIQHGSVEGLDTSCLKEIKPFFVTTSE